MTVINKRSTLYIDKDVKVCPECGGGVQRVKAIFMDSCSRTRRAYRYECMSCLKATGGWTKLAEADRDFKYNGLSVKIDEDGGVVEKEKACDSFYLFTEETPCPMCGEMVWSQWGTFPEYQFGVRGLCKHCHMATEAGAKQREWKEKVIAGKYRYHIDDLGYILREVHPHDSI